MGSHKLRPHGPSIGQFFLILYSYGQGFHSPLGVCAIRLKSPSWARDAALWSSTCLAGTRCEVPSLALQNENNTQGFSKTAGRGGAEFLYVGQTHGTFGILLLQLEMVTSEIRFALKDQPRIKMRMDPV